MLKFAEPAYFYMFLLIPVFIAAFLLMLAWKKNAMNRFGESRLVNLLMPDKSKSRAIVKFILLMLAFSLIIVGLANPQIGSKLEKIKRRVALWAGNREFNASELRDFLDTSRRFIIPLLEHFDKSGFTIRDQDTRTVAK